VNQFARVDKGALFENAVFSALRLKGELNYYQRKSGVEIDFILNKKSAYEVKTSPDQRDLARLSELARELKLKDYSIISRNYFSNERIKYGFMI